jgi:hypothetical protein
MTAKHILSSIRLAAVAGLAAIAAVSPAGAENSVQAQDMIRLTHTKLDEVWIRAAGTELSRFTAIYLSPLAIAYKDSDSDVMLDDDQLARMGEIIREEVAEALASRNGYAIADAPGPGVLEIRALLDDMDINASSLNDRPGQRTFVTSVGSMTLVAALRDSETGENLILVRDHVEGRDHRFMLATEATYRAEFRDAIADWSDLLRLKLDAARLAETGSY